MMENKNYDENQSDLEIVVVTDNDEYNEADFNKEYFMAGEELNSAPQAPPKKKKDYTKDIIKIATTGVAIGVGTLIIAGVSLVNFNYSATFKEFDYVDGFIEYVIDCDDYKDNDNDLTIYLYQGQKLEDKYSILTKYYDMAKTLDFDSYTCYDYDEEEGAYFTNTYSRYEYYDSNQELDNAAFAKDFEKRVNKLSSNGNIKFNVYDDDNQRSYYIKNKGQSVQIDGKLLFDKTKINKLSGNQTLTYSAALKGSAGLVDRTFDNYAIHVEVQVSEFRAENCTARCKHLEDGYYYVHLDYIDNLQIYSNFSVSLTGKDFHNPSEEKTIYADLSNQKMHNDIKMKVLGILAEGEATLVIEFDEKTEDGLDPIHHYYEYSKYTGYDIEI